MGVNKRSQEIDSSKGNKELTSFKRAVARKVNINISKNTPPEDEIIEGLPQIEN